MFDYVIEILFKSFKKWTFLYKGYIPFLKFFIRWSFTFRILNYFYNKLNTSNKITIYHLFSKIYRNSDSLHFKNKFWEIEFNNKIIHLPLRSHFYWLDWDSALSIIGHENIIKNVYEKLINSKIECFIDVGANYGLHSALFMSERIDTYYIEPNPNCHEYFKIVSDLNEWKATILDYAIGDKTSIEILSFPKHDTWFGSLNKVVKDNFENTENVENVKVNLRTLDSIVKELSIAPDLIKIDTESYEKYVLKGAVETLKKHSPIVIFENNNFVDRIEIYNLFTANNYLIYDINFNFDKDSFFNFDIFIKYKGFDFIALKKDFRF